MAFPQDARPWPRAHEAPTRPDDCSVEGNRILSPPAQDAAAVESKEAAAQRWQSRMEQMDPLFGALAALPWFVGVDAEKADHVKTVVLDTLEGDGAPGVSRGRQPLPG